MEKNLKELIHAMLDGNATAQQQHEIDQLAGRSEFAALLAREKSLRELRKLAWQLDIPSEDEARRETEDLIAAMHTSSDANASQVRIIKFLRVSAAAAVLALTAAGGYLVGRAKPMAPAHATKTPIVGYTVDITMQNGTRVSQTFTTFQQAEKFVQAYRLEQKLSPSRSTPKVQVASEGVF